MADVVDQAPIGGVEFAENPEPRCPSLPLLGTSGSMDHRLCTRGVRTMTLATLLAAALIALAAGGPPTPRAAASGDSGSFALDTRPRTSASGDSPAFPLETRPANDAWTIH